MSAVAAFAQRDRVHIAVDALKYTAEHVPCSFGPKVMTVAHWPGVITNVGACAALSLLAPKMAEAFASFDDLVARGNAVLPKLVDEWSQLLTAFGAPPTASEIIVAGISESGPRIFSFRTDDGLPPGVTRAEAEASPYWAKRPAQLVELPAQISTPVPADQVLPANWEGFDPDADAELMRWSMSKFLTMQRHTTLPADIGGIGGWGELTTVSKDGIEQRIICRWPFDKLGAPLVIEPIDWPAWHAANPKPNTRRAALRVVR